MNHKTKGLGIVVGEQATSNQSIFTSYKKRRKLINNQMRRLEINE
jgi:hypothetical protein